MLLPMIKQVNPGTTGELQELSRNSRAAPAGRRAAGRNPEVATRLITTHTYCIYDVSMCVVYMTTI